MARSVVLRVREQSRGPIGILLVVWATLQSVSWMGMLHNLAFTPRWWHLWVGSNIVFGILMGIRRRMGTIFSGPLFATVMNVFPTFVGFQLALNHGILWGLVGATLYYLLFGWLVYGAVQVAMLFVGAVIGRLLRAPFRRRSEVVVIGPDGQIR
ncbi:unannotated protein [freshwater metagenome]|uniref:Unannotated protein n=1 Tax=freshwater metagenome TaxID=449393 RepID=A0A6J7D5G8_9ZZZZ|nr:hypothetical protein [Actinomycetota bacterium]MUH57944.1 hypothetical protein [Actinomycetota bacterium]